MTLALFRVSLPWSARQQRHLAYLAEFTSSVVHVPDIKNVMADALSKPSPEPEPAPEPVSIPSASSLVPLTPSPSPPLILSDPVLSSYNFRHFSLQLSCPLVSEMRSSPSLSLVSVPLGASILAL